MTLTYLFLTIPKEEPTGAEPVEDLYTDGIRLAKAGGIYINKQTVSDARIK